MTIQRVEPVPLALPRIDRQRGAALLDELLRPSPVHLVMRLGVLLLMLHGGEWWYLAVPVRVVGTFALLSQRVLTHPVTWLVLLAAVGLGNATRWYEIDNHKYLMVYWTAVCALAAASAQPAQVLRHNARLLVTISFTLAVLWKLCTADFLDGRFLELLLLTDPRVEGVSSALCGLTRGQLAENRGVLALASIAPHDGLRAYLTGADRALLVARAVAIWTLAIEGAVALAFAWKDSPRARNVRNVLLLVFFVTTYPVLPVVGFALTLAILGLASSIDHRGWTITFGMVAALVAVAVLPWQSLLG